MTTDRAALALRIGYAAANRMAPDHQDLDDLAQEAAIRAAKVGETKPHAMAAAARFRVLDLLRGKPYTGNSGGRGLKDPLRHAETASLDSLREESDDDSVYAGLEEPGYAHVEWGGMAEDIDQAIETIPCRTDTPKRVTRLIMHGLSASEAGRRLGYTDAAGRSAWSSARPHLATELGHLRGWLV